MDERVAPVTTGTQTPSAPHTNLGTAPSVMEKTVKLRRQGACEMCRTKKIRCE